MDLFGNAQPSPSGDETVDSVYEPLPTSLKAICCDLIWTSDQRMSSGSVYAYRLHAEVVAERYVGLLLR
ncbi:hypothetical protein [Micromonospora sp. L31]